MEARWLFAASDSLEVGLSVRKKFLNPCSTVLVRIDFHLKVSLITVSRTICISQKTPVTLVKNNDIFYHKILVISSFS